MAVKLNADIPKAIAEFQALMHEILPKKIFYKLLLRGKGLEFDGYRNFDAGDDANSIDWKATKRANTLLVRQYIEEQDLKIMFVVDVGDNMIFGSREKVKCEYCAELVAALSHVAINAGDQVGFILYNDKNINVRLPSSGKRQFDIFVGELINSSNYGGTSDTKKIIDKVIEILAPSISLVIFISDFIKINSDAREKFLELASLFESIAIMIKDPLDVTLPEINKEIIIQNPGTEDRLVINPRVAKEIYELNARKQTNIVKNIFRDSNIDFLEVFTNDYFFSNVAGFLKKRAEGR